MSTLVSAALSSDDEEDLDFQLPEPKIKTKNRKRRRSGSATGSSSSDSDDAVDEVDTTEAQKLRADQEAVEAEERRKRAEAAFETFKTQPSINSDKIPPVSTSPTMIEVQRGRQFAGETITETVQLPADHPEAVAYLKKGLKSEETVTLSDFQTADQASPSMTPDTMASAEAGPSKPRAKPPPRRKPRQSLEAMSAALDKGKKMTTLEKSQMDWKKHTAADQAINAELEANRRAGGYLQKKDFLDRVGERRMDTFDSRQRPR